MERISSLKGFSDSKRVFSDRKKRKTVYARRKESLNRRISKKSMSAKSKAKSNYTDSFFDETEESTKTSIRRFDHSTNDKLFSAIEDFLNMKDVKMKSNTKPKTEKKISKGYGNGNRVMSPESNISIR
jgi:hypothetical protein